MVRQQYTVGISGEFQAFFLFVGVFQNCLIYNENVCWNFVRLPMVKQPAHTHMKVPQLRLNSGHEWIAK